MIEHLTIHVDDLDEARDFYEALLGPLGYVVTRRLPDHDDSPRVAFGRDRRAQLWLVEGSMAHEGLVLAVNADDADAVEAFRAAAESAGADEVTDAEESEDGRTTASAKDANGNRIVAVAGGSGRGMFDHVQMVVSDFGRTLRFYEKLLEPLEVATTARDLDNDDGPRVGFGQGGETSLWLTEEGDPQSGVAIGFSAASQRQVDEFHTDAVESGARKIAAPGVRKEVGPSYYVSGANDPDNNRVEAVHDGEHGLAPAAPVKVAGDKLAEAAELQRWEAERAQAKAAEIAEADKRSGRTMSLLSTAPLVMAAKDKPKAKADEEESSEATEDGESGEEDAFDLSSLGLDDAESDGETETASSDDEEIDWAALGLDDSAETSETETTSGDDEEIDWAALGLDDDEASTETSEDDGELDLSALGLDDDEAAVEEEPAAKKKDQPKKKPPMTKAAMGMDF